jgi:hypothetical protein
MELIAPAVSPLDSAAAGVAESIHGGHVPSCTA